MGIEKRLFGNFVPRRLFLSALHWLFFFLNGCLSSASRLFSFFGSENIRVFGVILRPGGSYKFALEVI